jgi:hypothetical protein
MRSSDDQHRLAARQGREIDQLGQKFHFNLAPPPISLNEITTRPKFVSLVDFIEQFHWEYSDLDIVDRRDIKQLAAEDFWCYLAKSEVPLEEPGHLSPVTVAPTHKTPISFTFRSSIETPKCQNLLVYDLSAGRHVVIIIGD